MKHYVTKSGFDLNEDNIVSILQEWGSNIQVGEQYSFQVIARFMLGLVSNSQDNNQVDLFVKHVTAKITEEQKHVIRELIVGLENYSE